MYHCLTKLIFFPVPTILTRYITNRKTLQGLFVSSFPSYYLTVYGILFTNNSNYNYRCARDRTTRHEISNATRRTWDSWLNIRRIIVIILIAAIARGYWRNNHRVTITWLAIFPEALPFRNATSVIHNWFVTYLIVTWKAYTLFTGWRTRRTNISRAVTKRNSSRGRAFLSLRSCLFFNENSPRVIVLR